MHYFTRLKLCVYKNYLIELSLTQQTYLFMEIYNIEFFRIPFKLE